MSMLSLVAASIAVALLFFVVWHIAIAATDHAIERFTNSVDSTCSIVLGSAADSLTIGADDSSPGELEIAASDSHRLVLEEFERSDVMRLLSATSTRVNLDDPGRIVAQGLFVTPFFTMHATDAGVLKRESRHRPSAVPTIYSLEDRGDQPLGITHTTRDTPFELANLVSPHGPLIPFKGVRVGGRVHQHAHTPGTDFFTPELLKRRALAGVTIVMSPGQSRCTAIMRRYKNERKGFVLFAAWCETERANPSIVKPPPSYMVEATGDRAGGNIQAIRDASLADVAAKCDAAGAECVGFSYRSESKVGILKRTEGLDRSYTPSDDWQFYAKGSIEQEPRAATSVSIRHVVFRDDAPPKLVANAVRALGWDDNGEFESDEFHAVVSDISKSEAMSADEIRAAMRTAVSVRVPIRLQDDDTVVAEVTPGVVRVSAFGARGVAPRSRIARVEDMMRDTSEFASDPSTPLQLAVAGTGTVLCLPTGDHIRLAEVLRAH